MYSRPSFIKHIHYISSSVNGIRDKPLYSSDQTASDFNGFNSFSLYSSENGHISVRMYVCLYVRTYVCMYVLMYVLMYVC